MSYILYKLGKLNSLLNVNKLLTPLSLCIYPDESGCIKFTDGSLLYEFESINELNTYLTIKTRFGGSSERI